MTEWIWLKSVNKTEKLTTKNINFLSYATQQNNILPIDIKWSCQINVGYIYINFFGHVHPYLILFRSCSNDKIRRCKFFWFYSNRFSVILIWSSKLATLKKLLMWHVSKIWSKDVGFTQIWMPTIRFGFNSVVNNLATNLTSMYVMVEPEVRCGNYVT